MVYGSNRVGVSYTNAPYSDTDTDTLGLFDAVRSRRLAEKSYELADHLGNVRVTVSDLLVAHGGAIDAEITTRTDYHPFGMPMQGRTYAADDAHRYGYNGKENDNEVKGDGNAVDYGARIFDPRIGRWMSVDPLAKEYETVAPYAFAFNTPISAVDSDGMRVYFVGGAGLDTKGWNYTERWGRAINSNGIANFHPVRGVSHDAPGSFPTNDILFTTSNSHKTTEKVPASIDSRGNPLSWKDVPIATTSAMVQKAANYIQNDLMQHPLSEGEQHNLMGYSYGSVLQAHVALELANRGVVVDNLILVGVGVRRDK